MIKKELELGKKLALGRDAINNTDRVIDVIGRNQAVTGVFDGAHMARSDVAGSTDESEIFHGSSYGNERIRPTFWHERIDMLGWVIKP